MSGRWIERSKDQRWKNEPLTDDVDRDDPTLLGELDDRLSNHAVGAVLDDHVAFFFFPRIRTMNDDE